MVYNGLGVLHKLLFRQILVNAYGLKDATPQAMRVVKASTPLRILHLELLALVIANE
jgi:hypothetical protein